MEPHIMQEHLISEKLVAMVRNGSERVGGDHPSLSTSWERRGGSGQSENNQIMPLHNLVEANMYH